MNGFGRRVRRKRGLLTLLVLLGGLFLVLSIMPRRRGRREAQPVDVGDTKAESAVSELRAEPPDVAEPSAANAPPDAPVANEDETTPRSQNGVQHWAQRVAAFTLFAALALVVTIPNAVGSHSSPYIDLTSAGNTVAHDGVIFAAGVGPAGTGQFDPFLTVSPGGSATTEVGYNSDAQGAGTTDDDVFYGGDRTHTLRASAIPPTVVGGVEYREFSLDGNDQGSDDFMSIDKIEIYIDTEAGVKGYTDGAGCTPGTFSVNTGPVPVQIYCLDAGGPQTILMKTQGLSSGSGQSDITVLIPSSIFPAECFYGALACNKWVTFWFEAGFTGSLTAGSGCSGTCDYDVSAGFEEWRTRKLPVVNVTKTVTASITRKFDWTVKKYVSTDDNCLVGFIDAQDAATGLHIDLFNGQSDTVCWQIVSDRGEPTLSNGAISGEITITNPTGGTVITFEVDAVLNDVTDVVDQGGPSPATVTCPFSFPHTLDPGESVVCTYTKSTTSTTGGTNTAHAFVDNGTNPDLQYSSPAEPFTVTTNDEDENASLDDSRSLPGAPIALSGDDTRVYTEVLSCPSSRTETNTATLTETDTNTTHTDPAVVNITCHTLDVSKTANTSFNRTFDWTVQKLVSADDNCQAGFVDANDVASALVINLFNGDSDTVCWKIISDRGAPQDSGFAVAGTITITNNAPLAAMPVSVTDVLTGSIAATVDCDPATMGNQNTGLTVPAKVGPTPGTLTCSYSTGVPDATTRTNTATASLAGQAYTGTAQAIFDSSTPTTETDDTATLDDSRTPGLPGAPLALTGDDTQTYTEVLPCGSDRNETNTATLMEDDSGAVRTDPAVVRIDCHGLTVTKDANPTYTRTFDWTVKKYVSTDDTCTTGFVDGTLSITLNVGQSDTVCWQIVSDRGDPVDSDFKVSGTIRITNDAPIAANGVVVTDSLAGPVAATVDCDPVAPSNQNTVDVPASSFKECTYEAFPSDATDRLNTATATLFGQGYQGTALADFGDPTTVIDETATLDDSRTLPGAPLALSGDNTRSYTETLPCGETRTETNTATLTEDDSGQIRTDPAAVDLTCVPVGEGCTPGFWKNHPELWDGIGSDDVTTTIQTTDAFNATFGVTSTQSGLADDFTLLQAVDLNGGGLTALNRHAAAAAVSADAAGVDYAFTLAQVIAIYQDAVGAIAGPETVQSALAKLQTENERGCPLS